MREKTDRETNPAAKVGRPVPWVVVEVQVLPDYCLTVRFRDGTEGLVDVSRLILSPKAGVFGTLRDPEMFRRAYVDYGAVTWPSGVDMAPDAMYDEIKATGRWVVND